MSPTSTDALPDLRDIVGIEHVSEDASSLLPVLVWVLAATAATLAIGAVIILRRRRRNSLSATPGAAAKALSEIEQLRADSAKISNLELHEEIASIIRRFVVERFSVPATQRTSEEWLSELKRSGRVSVDAQHLLEPLVERCDMVKFAQLQLSRDETAQSFGLAKEFVSQGV